MHVEVAVERLHRRFGVDVELAQPRVPYLETIRKESRARARYKKQTGGRGQFGDCEIVLEPRPGHEGYEFVDKIVGGVIPQGFRPAVDKGIQEAMLHGDLAGAPVQGVTVRLVDGQYHNVDSSEMAFKIAGSMAFKDAYQKADPMLLEPIMELDVTVPDEAVGAVNGDLNSRRGRLLGMEPLGGMTTIKAEVPMAEVLTYSQSLTSLTGGRGDYAMSFLRYEEVPSHIAQKVMEERGRRRRRRHSSVSTECRGGAAPAVSVRDLRARSLLVGERTERFSPDGLEYVDVCPLCREQALEAGWYREGGPSLHVRPREQRRGIFAQLFGAVRRVGEPVARADAAPSLAEDQVVVQAASLFNGSSHPAHGRGPDPQPRRRRGGDPPRRAIARPSSPSAGTSRGTSTASMPDEPQPVRLIERGFDLARSRGGADGVERRGRPRGPARSGCRTRARSIALPGADARRRGTYNQEAVIYCVVPPELETELYTRSSSTTRTTRT